MGLVADVLPKILGPIPGDRSRQLAERLQAVEAPNVTFVSRGFPIFWERASGTNVWDVDDNRFLDLTGAFAVASLGHSAPDLVTAMSSQAERVMHGMGDVHPTEVMVLLCEKLAELTFGGWGVGAG